MNYKEVPWSKLRDLKRRIDRLERNLFILVLIELIKLAYKYYDFLIEVSQQN